MNVDRKPLLVVVLGVAVVAVLPRLVRTALLRLTSTAVRDERHGDLHAKPPWS